VTSVGGSTESDTSGERSRSRRFGVRNQPSRSLWGRGLAKYGLPIASFAVGIGIWQLVVAEGLVRDYLVPRPTAIVRVLFNGKIDWVHQTLVTFNEAIVGFLIGVGIGVLLAVLISLSPILNQILMPYVVALQVLPKVAIAPIIYILIGFTNTSRIILIVILTFFPMVINMSTGLTDVDRNLVHLLQSLGAGRIRIFYKVRLPNSLPSFFDGLKIAVSGALVGAIVAEFVSSNSGLGFVILNSQYTFNTTAAFGAFAILTVLGLLLYGAVIFLGRRLMPWYRGS
jgi:NitT/TauT family transport system permease protein